MQGRHLLLCAILALSAYEARAEAVVVRRPVAPGPTVVRDVRSPGVGAPGVGVRRGVGVGAPGAGLTVRGPAGIGR
jgi:hypothetical protein